MVAVYLTMLSYRCAALRGVFARARGSLNADSDVFFARRCAAFLHVQKRAKSRAHVQKRAKMSKMSKNVENVEKCRKISKNVEKCRKMRFQAFLQLIFNFGYSDAMRATFDYIVETPLASRTISQIPKSAFLAPRHVYFGRYSAAKLFICSAISRLTKVRESPFFYHRCVLSRATNL